MYGIVTVSLVSSSMSLGSLFWDVHLIILYCMFSLLNRKRKILHWVMRVCPFIGFVFIRIFIYDCENFAVILCYGAVVVKVSIL
jgi:hypothetical protein